MKVKQSAVLNTLLATALLLAPLTVTAMTTTETANVKSELTHLFLWSDDPAAMQFADIDLGSGKLVDWSLVSLGDAGGAPLIAEGPALKQGWAKFDIDFSYQVAPFSFQFAAVMYDAVTSTPVIANEGNFTFNGSKLNKAIATPLSVLQIADVNNYFAPAAAVVPLPDSMLLALSALGFVGLFSRKAVPGASVMTNAA